MIKCVSIIVVCSLIVLISGCTNDCDLSKMEDQNIETIRYIHAEMAAGNMDVFDKKLKEDYVRHCQAMPPELQEIHGIEQLKLFVADFIASVSDFSETFDVIVADSNMVAYQTTMRGRQTGVMGGMPATGKDFTVVNIIIHRFEDGKIAETWVTWDNLAMLAQLGLFPPPVEDKQ